MRYGKRHHLENEVELARAMGHTVLVVDQKYLDSKKPLKGSKEGAVIEVKTKADKQIETKKR